MVNITQNLTMPMWRGLEYFGRLEIDPYATLGDVAQYEPMPGTTCALIDRELLTTATEDTDYQHRLTDSGWSALRTRNPELPHVWINGRNYLRTITTLILCACLDVLAERTPLNADDRVKQNMIVSVLRERHSSVDDAWRAWVLDGTPETTEASIVTAAARQAMR